MWAFRTPALVYMDLVARDVDPTSKKDYGEQTQNEAQARYAGQT